MRQLVENKWCDPCDADSPPDAEPEDRIKVRAEFEVWVLAAANSSAAPVRLDMCVMHHKQYVTPLVELIHSHGANTQGVTPRRAKPKITVDLTPPRALAHNGRTTIASLDQDVTCPLCTLAMRPKTMPKHVAARHPEVVFDSPIDHCPQCAWVPTEFSGQAVSMHRNRMHGYDKIADLLDVLQVHARST